MTEKIYGYSFDLGNGMLAAYSVDDKTITLSNRNFNTQKYIESEARALCAALLECGFGPEVKPVEYCRWTPIGKENRWNTACGGTVGSATGPLHAVCDICGKRIEVVK